jgi:hypothetical protein
LNVPVVAAVVITASALAFWRRSRMPAERREQAESRRDLTMRKVEAWAFPAVGVVIVGAALSYWRGWVSVATMTLGGLFVLVGIKSFQDSRKRRGVP